MILGNPKIWCTSGLEVHKHYVVALLRAEALATDYGIVSIPHGRSEAEYAKLCFGKQIAGEEDEYRPFMDVDMQPPDQPPRPQPPRQQRPRLQGDELAESLAPIEGQVGHEAGPFGRDAIADVSDPFDASAEQDTLSDIERLLDFFASDAESEQDNLDRIAPPSQPQPTPPARSGAQLAVAASSSDAPPAAVPPVSAAAAPIEVAGGSDAPPLAPAAAAAYREGVPEEMLLRGGRYGAFKINVKLGKTLGWPLSARFFSGSKNKPTIFGFRLVFLVFVCCKPSFWGAEFSHFSIWAVCAEARGHHLSAARIHPSQRSSGTAAPVVHQWGLLMWAAGLKDFVWGCGAEDSAPKICCRGLEDVCAS